MTGHTTIVSGTEKQNNFNKIKVKQNVWNLGLVVVDSRILNENHVVD